MLRLPPRSASRSKRRHYGVRIAEDDTFEESRTVFSEDPCRMSFNACSRIFHRAAIRWIAASPANDSGNGVHARCDVDLRQVFDEVRAKRRSTV